MGRTDHETWAFIFLAIPSFENILSLQSQSSDSEISIGTELIPQTAAAINAGTVYYHLSIQYFDTNAPASSASIKSPSLRAGWISGELGTSDPMLRWDVNSVTQWNTTWEAGVWHNIAYAIDFAAGSVAFYHSTGADDLIITVPAVSLSASSNGEDFHVGVLELPRDEYTDTTDDIYFSGVYVERGDLTASVAGPDGAANVSHLLPLQRQQQLLRSYLTTARQHLRL